MDEATVRAAITSIYHGDAASRHEADTYLMNFQRSPEAWAICQRLLESTNVEEAFVAAQTLYQKMRREWSTLPVEHREMLKGLLLSTIERYITTGGSFTAILRRLCSALAQWVVLRISDNDGGLNLRTHPLLPIFLPPSIHASFASFSYDPATSGPSAASSSDGSPLPLLEPSSVVQESAFASFLFQSSSDPTSWNTMAPLHLYILDWLTAVTEEAESTELTYKSSELVREQLKLRNTFVVDQVTRILKSPASASAPHLHSSALRCLNAWIKFGVHLGSLLEGELVPMLFDIISKAASDPLAHSLIEPASDVLSCIFEEHVHTSRYEPLLQCMERTVALTPLFSACVLSDDQTVCRWIASTAIALGNHHVDLLTGTVGTAAAASAFRAASSVSSASEEPKPIDPRCIRFIEFMLTQVTAHPDMDISELAFEFWTQLQDVLTTESLRRPFESVFQQLFSVLYPKSIIPLSALDDPEDLESFFSFREFLSNTLESSFYVLRNSYIFAVGPILASNLQALREALRVSTTSLPWRPVEQGLFAVNAVAQCLVLDVRHAESDPTAKAVCELIATAQQCCPPPHTSSLLPYLCLSILKSIGSYSRWFSASSALLAPAAQYVMACAAAAAAAASSSSSPSPSSPSMLLLSESISTLRSLCIQSATHFTRVHNISSFDDEYDQEYDDEEEEEIYGREASASSSKPVVDAATKAAQLCAQQADASSSLEQMTSSLLEMCLNASFLSAIPPESRCSLYSAVGELLAVSMDPVSSSKRMTDLCGLMAAQFDAAVTALKQHLSTGNVESANQLYQTSLRRSILLSLQCVEHLFKSFSNITEASRDAALSGASRVWESLGSLSTTLAPLLRSDNDLVSTLCNVYSSVFTAGEASDPRFEALSRAVVSVAQVLYETTHTSEPLTLLRTSISALGSVEHGAVIASAASSAFSVTAAFAGHNPSEHPEEISGLLDLLHSVLRSHRESAASLPILSDAVSLAMACIPSTDRAVCRNACNFLMLLFEQSESSTAHLFAPVLSAHVTNVLSTLIQTVFGSRTTQEYLFALLYLFISKFSAPTKQVLEHMFGTEGFPSPRLLPAEKVVMVQTMLKIRDKFRFRRTLSDFLMQIFPL